MPDDAGRRDHAGLAGDLLVKVGHKLPGGWLA